MGHRWWRTAATSIKTSREGSFSRQETWVRPLVAATFITRPRQPRENREIHIPHLYSTPPLLPGKLGPRRNFAKMFSTGKSTRCLKNPDSYD